MKNRCNKPSVIIVVVELFRRLIPLMGYVIFVASAIIASFDVHDNELTFATVTVIQRLIQFVSSHSLH